MGNAAIWSFAPSELLQKRQVEYIAGNTAKQPMRCNFEVPFSDSDVTSGGWRARPPRSGRNNGLDRLARLDRRERVGGVSKVVPPAHHLAPGHAIAEAGRELDGAMEVVVLRAPAAVDLDVLAVDLPVRVNLDGTVVRVVAADDDAAAVANDVERLRDGVRAAARFDDDVGTATACRGADIGEAVLTR